MKQHEVETGKIYIAKVSDKLTKVRIDDVSPHGGWTATNIATGKKIRIRSPQRLRAEADKAPKKTKATKSVPLLETAITRRAEAAVADAVVESAQTPASAKPMSGLDAAAKVLADAATPLNAKEILERILAQGLWNTGGKTPQATLHAAISREIKVKGHAARFRKAERGHFTVAG